jgi:hypothetical protein
VIWSPVQVLRDVAAERNVLAGFIVTAVYAALSLVAAAVAVLGGVTRAQFEGQTTPPGLPPDLLDNIVAATEIVTLIFAILSPFVWWLLVSLVIQLATRFFGGSGPLSAMLAAVGVAGVPLALGALAQALATALQVVLGVGSTAGVMVGTLGGLLALAALVWYVVLVVIGAALARGIGYGEAAGSCAVSCAGCLALIILVGVVLVGIGILVGTTATQ